MRAELTLPRALAGALAVVVLGAPAAAQTLDRTKEPPVAAAPALRVPAWTTSTLANGAQLLVSQRRGLPLVSFSVSFVGGTNQFEPAGKRGLGSLAVAMLNEGTSTKSGDELSNAWQLLGTSVQGGVAGERGSLSFISTRQRFPAAVALLTDMLVNPSLPPEALERLRGRTLVQLQQARDQPPVIAGRVFPRVLYGEAHPYGQSSSEETVRAITRDDVASFTRTYFQPGHAIVTVVGDVEPAAVKAMLDRTMASWTGSTPRPTFDYPAVPASAATTIYLVDKPGAAQSSVSIGLPGPARDTPDYYALQVMNTTLGGFFQSRLNANIREKHGYSYGVRSQFSYGRGPGPFRASGEIVTAKTDSALIEFMRELRGVQGERPFTQAELDQAKASLIQSLPERFSSTAAVNNTITGLYLDGLPADYYQRFAANVNAVTLDDLTRVARRYIDLQHLAIVVVGDRSKIEAPLRATGVAPIVLLDGNGVPVAATPAGTE
ncbi:MAG TPA: pitrilysin family protein [Longimicrobiaceae bacterium]|nr:pitrilysin family protein [Longimicrobiaceae bacterium]